MNAFDHKIFELSGKLDDHINDQMHHKFHDKLINKMDDKTYYQIEDELGWNIKWAVSDLIEDFNAII